MSMQQKPIIGISGSMIIDQGGMFPGYKRAYVNNDYIESVVLAGGIPYIVPMVGNDEIIKEQIKNVDAIIMSGGHDANPMLWGEEPHQKLGDIYPERDEFDIKLIKFAMEMKKPILGICRGEQILNVANGGSLYQDLSMIEGCYIKHNQGHTPDIATHTVNLVEGTKLREILGEKTTANSFHHLCVKDVAPGFKISALAQDGAIEAIEKDDDYFVMGIQWHPEMMTKKRNDMLKIFERLVQEAKK